MADPPWAVLGCCLLRGRGGCSARWGLCACPLHPMASKGLKMRAKAGLELRANPNPNAGTQESMQNPLGEKEKGGAGRSS